MYPKAEVSKVSSVITMKTVVTDDTLFTFVFLYHSGMPHLKILQRKQIQWFILP
jgi:hypothetical protein